MLKVGETKEIKVMLLDDDGNPIAGTVTYTVYDENDASFATGTMAVTGVTGLYTMSFTPDVAGAWSVLFICSDPNRTAVKMFDVGVGVEQASYNAIVVLSTALTTHDTAIKALLATIQTDLDNPNQYKADISALALEATLTAMKGGGWTTETLKVIKDAIDALNNLSANDIWTHGTRTLTDPNNYKANVAALALEATLSTHDTDIKALLATIGGYLDTEIADIKTETDKIPTLLTESQSHPTLAEIEAGDMAAIKTETDKIAGLITESESHPTLAEIEAGDVAAIKTETDKIPTLLTESQSHPTLAEIEAGEVGDVLDDTADMQPRIPRIVTHMDFKSLPLQITLTSTAGDRGLVDIVVSGLPAGVTIIAVEAFLYCDTVENTFDGVNYLESTKIQVKEKTAGTDRDAITLEANKIFRFTAMMIRGGTVLTPDWATATAADILAEVVGNATYQMWFDVGETVQNNIVLDGAVFMLRIWFSV